MCNEDTVRKKWSHRTSPVAWLNRGSGKSDTSSCGKKHRLRHDTKHIYFRDSSISCAPKTNGLSVSL